MPIREAQTTNRQHAIPQSIMSVEFKLIGDLTLKQFFFLMIFAGLAYACFMLFNNPVFKWGGVAINSCIGLAFAFLPLGDRGLDQWIVNFIRAMYGPSQYVWKKVAVVPNVFSYQNVDILKHELITLTPTTSRRKIEAFLEMQPRVKDEIEVLEEQYVGKLRDTYTALAATQVETIPAPPVIAPAQTPRVASETPAPLQEFVNRPELPAPAPTQTPIQETTPTPTPENKTDETQQAQAVQPHTVAPEVPLTVEKPADLQIRRETPAEPVKQNIDLQPAYPQKPDITQQPISPSTQTSEEKTSNKQGRLSTLQVSPVIQEPPKEERPLTRGSYVPKKVYTAPITPDQHAGRRFINLTPSSGKIVLPIRGETVLKSIEEETYQEDLRTRAKQLDNLLSQIKQQENAQKKVVQAQKEQEEQRLKLEKEREETEKLKQAELAADQKNREELERREREQKAQEEARLREEERLKAEAERIQKEKEELEKAKREEEQRIAKEAAEREEKRKLLESIQAQNTPKQESEPSATPIVETNGAVLQTIMMTPQTEATPINIKDLKKPVNETDPTLPNVINAIVKGPEPLMEPLGGVVAVIKNERKEVVRALKTSGQGRFGISTPLSNGNYIIEIDREKKSGYIFDPVSFSARGEIIPTIQIVGRI